MRYVLPVCVVLALAITAQGQQSGTDPLAAAASCEVQLDTTGRRLQQLRQRAYELEQAGDPNQAAAVHRQAEQESLALLGRLDALEAEAAQVRQALGAGTQVVMQLQVVELPITKLRSLGFDLTKILKRASGPSVPKAGADQTEGKAQAEFFIGDGTEAQELFAALREDKLLKVLAEPTLVTLSGRTVFFNSGGEVPVPKRQPDGSVAIEYQRGTMVQLTPEVLGDRVCLAFRCRLMETDPKYTMRVGQQTMPGVQTVECDTRTEMKSGETVVLGGLTSRVRVGETRDEVATYFLIRAEIVQTLPTASYPATLGSQASAPAPHPVRPVNAPGNAPSATARRSTDGDIQR
jgi:Flp pilus assembly secretin CpaC